MSNQNPSPQNEGKYSLFMGFVYVSNLIVGTGMADYLFFFENFSFFQKNYFEGDFSKKFSGLTLGRFPRISTQILWVFFTPMGFKLTILIFKTK